MKISLAYSGWIGYNQGLTIEEFTMSNIYLTEIFKGFQALTTPAEKVQYLQRVSKAGGFNGYNINVPALIKAWSK